MSCEHCAAPQSPRWTKSLFACWRERAEIILQAGKPPPSSTCLFRWRRRDWGRSRHRQTKRQGQHWQIKTQKTCCGYSAHHTATRDRMGTTWLPRFGPSCRRPINLELNLPTLRCPWEGGGISRGERDSALWPLCRSSERSIASKPTSLFSSSFKVEMECTTTSDLGRIENEQNLPSLADLPPFQMPSFNLSLQPHDYECALRFRGIQGPRESSRGDGSWQTATEKKGGGAKSRDGGKKVERGGEARKGC